ncbi:hypothetical protein FSP39_006450 [Pinctada imbricata]|uniref:C2H2-type domain-containing protein n=1 Tax=Pinctada imbricata TaxID=66713 RepID=A0AA88XKN0_PINIB|nr:hypothetical protein FSP39_006450 [Pinctada imbricata]
MPLIKTTPRKEMKCPMCPFKAFDLEQMKEHIAACGMKNLEKLYSCSEVNCTYNTNKLSNLTRHKKKHMKSQSKTQQSDGEWQRTDPGNLSDIVGGASESESDVCEIQNTSNSFESGRIVRRPTRPAPVFAPPRPTLNIPMPPDYSDEPAVCASPSLAGTSDNPPRNNPASTPVVFPLGQSRPCVSSTNVACEKVDASVQTSRPKKRRTTWTITRWSEDDKDIEQVELIEEDLEE